ncbi:OmpP1/FadL family transporter [Epilithonimonas lactis]|uniref:Hemin receptor n=1 Tax=Epilithonimonas lactis TaxID=421072 RepID=A0A085B910_9FLAO|nr:hemin receptor [Epilithonimonas lactis]KFC18955.1 hemin receptor [Epilithonimonas lactis]SEQ96989.1 Long-chain fatty acid transport protein [Epilithonimonas lactis]
MLKKTLLLLSIPISFVYLKAQDISVLTNTVDVYSANPINGTAKYNSMAGSVGALGGDISSANVNPAGIGVFITNDLNLTLGVNSNKNATTLAGNSLNYKTNNTDISNSGGVLTINLGDTASKWKFVNVGVNYSTRSLDNYSESPANGNIKIVDNLSTPGTPINYTFRGHAYDRYGDQSKLNFAVGANYDNRIYLGAGLNFHNSFLTQNDTAGFYSDYDNTSLAYSKQYTGFEEHSDGFSANVGVIAKLSNQFRVGAALESPTWWSIDRVYNQYYYNSNQADVFGEDRNLVTPMKATLSAAFVPSKNFALNVDFIQGITKPKYKEYGDAERELNDFFSDSYKNSSEVRVGAEYRISAFRLRGGYAYQGNNFDNLSLLSYNDNGSTSNQSYSNLLVGKRNTIGAGLGYDFQAFYIDASYQSITSEYSSPFLQGNIDYNSGYFNGGFDVNSEAYAVSKVKNTRNNFFVTVGWKF